MMDQKPTGPYKYYERPKKGRASDRNPAKSDRYWNVTMTFLLIVLFILIPVTYQLSSINIHKVEQAMEVQKVDKTKKNVKQSNNKKKAKEITKTKKDNSPINKKKVKKNAQQSSSVNKSQKQEKIYVVQTGDTLTSIAQKHGMTVSELMQMNNLTYTAGIDAGQTIKVK